MATIVSLFLILLLAPSRVVGHGCPAFSVAEDQTILDTDLVPPSFKTFVEQLANTTQVFTGVYDCHEDRDGYEVAVSAICQGTSIKAGGDEQCICQALYQFQECRSCSICSLNGELNLTTFSADCSNVVAGEYTNCMVQCGFNTLGCYPNDASSASSLQVFLVLCLFWFLSVAILVAEE